MNQPPHAPPPGLPFAALAALRASAGLLPTEVLADGTLTRYHFGLLDPDEEAEVTECLATDPRLAHQSDSLRAQRDEWLSRQTPAETLELWPVDFWHDLDLARARGYPELDDEALIDALLADPARLLPPPNTRKHPAFRIQCDDRSLELSPAPTGLAVTCVLGMTTPATKLAGQSCQLQIGEFATPAARIRRSATSLVAAARFSPATTRALAKTAPTIRTFRLTRSLPWKRE